MSNKVATLTPAVLHIVKERGTEFPGTGLYDRFSGKGSYLCRQCGLALFRSDQKFLSSCGWPSFDEELPGSIKRLPDLDGRRTEIRCHRCDAHLGHVFQGEGFTAKNLRHCVNSLAIEFVEEVSVMDTEEAIYAGGCFWGIQHAFDQCKGVLKTEVGYTGGQLHSPTYHQVCAGNTGHFEAVRVIYSPVKIDYKTLTQYFFEIHNPTHSHGQGVDHGSQYLSAIFYLDEAQHQIAKEQLEKLKLSGIPAVTQLRPASIFWPAEEYHQHYYEKTGRAPSCR